MKPYVFYHSIRKHALGLLGPGLNSQCEERFSQRVVIIETVLVVENIVHVFRLRHDIHLLSAQCDGNRLVCPSSVVSVASN